MTLEQGAAIIANADLTPPGAANSASPSPEHPSFLPPITDHRSLGTPPPPKPGGRSASIESLNWAAHYATAEDFRATYQERADELIERFTGHPDIHPYLIPRLRDIAE